jgi:hypothetical protein
LPLSVTEESVPNVVLSVTVAPPEVKLFPLASFNWTVMVDVLVPLAVIDEGEAVMVDVVALAVPATNATVSLSVMVTPLTVPVRVDVPAVVEEVNVAL